MKAQIIVYMLSGHVIQGQWEEFGNDELNNSLVDILENIGKADSGFMVNEGDRIIIVKGKDIESVVIETDHDG